MTRTNKLVMGTLSVFWLIAAVGCARKKVPVASSPPPPAPQTFVAPQPNPPTISEFTAFPSRIERGQFSLLHWEVKDAAEIAINQGIGAVAASGRMRVMPREATTYTLTATGPGGTASASAAVDVAIPPPPSPPPAPPSPTLTERLQGVHDAYFDFDKSNIRSDAMTVLTEDAAALTNILRDFPNTTVVLEGHCDERGSSEYNLALGDRRAISAKEFLGQVGLDTGRLLTISYGKERPQCTESTEECWQKNRRVHFAPGEQQKPAVIRVVPESGDSQTAQP